ncbi:hypothetical protein [Formosa sp. 4Alg 33]|uniref:hypothetical protein n=1 Tax=Formosa sp. 4Alg 33 TaxID=3382189 RepID=UPI003D9C62F3
MKRIVFGVLLLLLSSYTIKAQINTTMVEKEFANSEGLNVKAVYTASDNKQSEADYIIIKSDFEIPVSYESSVRSSSNHNSKSKLNIASEDLNAINHSLFRLQSFSIFTVVDLNSLQVATNLDDINYVSPDLKKLLPQGFNPYLGMIQETFNFSPFKN